MSREEAAQELERLAKVLRDGDPKTEVSFSINLRFRPVKDVEAR